MFWLIDLPLYRSKIQFFFQYLNLCVCQHTMTQKDLTNHLISIIFHHQHPYLIYWLIKKLRGITRSRKVTVKLSWRYQMLRRPFFIVSLTRIAFKSIPFFRSSFFKKFISSLIYCILKAISSVDKSNPPETTSASVLFLHFQ